MSRIFLSYAAEDAADAARVHGALSAEGCEVFFADQVVQPGDDFHAGIRRALQRADLLVFLASPASLQPGCFTLTELSWAQARWPNPTCRVLTVLLGGTAPGDLPGYLRATTALSPRGDLAAECRVAVARLLKRLRYRRLGAFLALALPSAAVAALGVAAWRDGREPAVDPPSAPVEAALHLLQRVPAGPESAASGPVPISQPPTYRGTEIDGCILSTADPTSADQLCAEAAQRLIATFYCQRMGYGAAASFTVAAQPQGTDAWKLKFEPTPDGQSWEAGWLKTHNAGFRFTQIRCH